MTTFRTHLWLELLNTVVVSWWPLTDVLRFCKAHWNYYFRFTHAHWAN